MSDFILIMQKNVDNEPSTTQGNGSGQRIGEESFMSPNFQSSHGVLPRWMDWVIHIRL